MLVKGIHPEDTIIKKYKPKTRVLKYKKQTLSEFKVEFRYSTVIGWRLHSPTFNNG